MRQKDLKNWPRRDHFELFNTFDYPHFCICANVDLTAFYPMVKQRGISFTVAVVYLIARTANAIPEFRQRIRAGEVVEHDIVHPSTTFLTTDDLFSFCFLEYDEDFSTFAVRSTEKIAQLRKNPTIKEESLEDNQLYMTSIPWVSFTSIMHPLKLYPADSVPRFAWGKFFEEGNKIKMPLSVQGHHALIDGIHAGRFYEKIQDYLDEPETLLSNE